MNETASVVARPPRSWELQTWLLMAVAGASAVLGLVELTALIGLRNVLATGGSSGTSVLTVFVLEHARTLDSVYFALVLAYILYFSWWRSLTRKLLVRFGHPDYQVFKHWAVISWNVLLWVSVLARLVGNGVTDPLTRLTPLIIGLAIRLGALALLLIGVWQIRGQIRLALATGPAEVVPVQVTPEPVAPPTILDTAAPAPADDAFWERVRTMSYAAGGDLALLESTSRLIRRWSLIPSAAAVDQIRAALPPGTVVTVFPTSPRPGASAKSFPVPTDPESEWVGLTEDTGTGMLWFQLLQPWRIPDWLAKAAKANRFALYRADDPAAATAVIPAAVRV